MPPSAWKPIMMRLWTNGASKSNVGATRHRWPNAVTGPSIPTIAWLLAAWRHSGRRGFANSARLKPRWTVANGNDRAGSAMTSVAHSSLSAKDVRRVWSAPTTTDRDRKELLRTLLEEVTFVVERAEHRARLAIRWRSGDISRLEVALPRSNPATRKTDEETVDIIRRLAAHHADGVIAGVLNRQDRRTVSGDRFTPPTMFRPCAITARIPGCKASAEPPVGEPVSVREAAKVFGLTPSTLLRWIEAGFIPAEQPTPGAPWQIRITEDLLGRFVEKAPPGFVPMIEATKLLGVTRQTVLQRVKRGELEAVHIRVGRRKGLRIKVPDAPTDLFGATTMNRGQSDEQSKNFSRSTSTTIRRPD